MLELLHGSCAIRRCSAEHSSRHGYGRASSKGLMLDTMSSIPVPAPALPPLEGVAVSLRPLRPEDYAPIQALEVAGDLAVRWRFRGSTPSPEEWHQRTWSGVLAQFVVVARSSGRPNGLVTCYQPNFQDGYANLAAVRFGGAVRTPVLMLGLALFVDYVFSIWDFHKLYMEAPDFNVAQFASGLGTYFEEEGRLRRHLYIGHARHDQLILALHRDNWIAVRERLIPHKGNSVA
jgi:hypothetical protein